MTTTSGPPSYEVTIENTLYSWDKDTISPQEIRSLANLATDCPILQVDLVNQTETPMAEHEIHHLQHLDPGKGIVKRVGFRAGRR